MNMMSGRRGQDLVTLILAFCLFISPWVIGFVADATPSWNAWVAAIVLGAFAVMTLSAFAATSISPAAVFRARNREPAFGVSLRMRHITLACRLAPALIAARPIGREAPGRIRLGACSFPRQVRARPGTAAGSGAFPALGCAHDAHLV